MASVLQGLVWKTCLVFLDDIIVYSQDFQEHLQRLKTVFDRLRQANLRLKPKKCEFGKERIRFLGHYVSSEGIELVFSKYSFWWDRVGMDFSGRVPGYSRRWAIIGDSTKISTFTNLKLTQIIGSNHFLYISSATFFAFKTVQHRRNVNQEKISVHSKHGCLFQCP